MTGRPNGFTLIELVMVIVITGIMAASIAVFFVPAVNAYFDTRRRAEMTDAADTALRRMARDVRRAVPNSIRVPASLPCFELVPTTAGGLYRRAADIANAGADPLDITAPDVSFDVLSTLATTPAAGDFVVIGNQNTNDVYTGTTRGTISAWTTPDPAGATAGTGRITLTTATQFPASYDGGRFQVVAAKEQSVFYICDAATHTLRRLVRPFTAAYPAACPAGGEVLASNVDTCEFVYDPNQGATQQSGFVWMRIELLSSGERMALSHGAHVSNVP